MAAAAAAARRGRWRRRRDFSCRPGRRKRKRRRRGRRRRRRGGGGGGEDGKGSEGGGGEGWGGGEGGCGGDGGEGWGGEWHAAARDTLAGRACPGGDTASVSRHHTHAPAPAATPASAHALAHTPPRIWLHHRCPRRRRLTRGPRRSTAPSFRAAGAAACGDGRRPARDARRRGGPRRAAVPPVPLDGRHSVQLPGKVHGSGASHPVIPKP